MKRNGAKARSDCRCTPFRTGFSPILLYCRLLQLTAGQAESIEKKLFIFEALLLPFRKKTYLCRR
jgi:hypothetical protein